MFARTARTIAQRNLSSTACAAPQPSPDVLEEPNLKRSDNSLRSIYLDAQATTPMDPRVLDAMMPWMTHGYGNAHSRTHHFGWESEDAVEKARGEIAALLNCSASEIIFTSGATESNNTLIKGIMRFLKGKKKHIITTQVEHKCVLDSCRALQQEGFEVTYLPVSAAGLVDLAQLEAAIRPDTGLVSVMMVNNEIGTVQPIADIARICKAKGVKLHTDAAQAVGKMPVDVEALGVDCLSLSSHKLYGPKGAGAMYVRRRPRLRIEPLMSGGGQERGMRSGTLPTLLAVGLGAACRVAGEEMVRDHAHVSGLANKLYGSLAKELEHIQLNGPTLDSNQRYNGNLNISFAFVEGESLLMGMKRLAVSSGSACTSASLEPSYVLRALGVQDDMAHTSIRYGIGRFTTEKEVDHAIEMTVREVNRLREMSPLWEMVQEGIDPSSIQWTH